MTPLRRGEDPGVIIFSLKELRTARMIFSLLVPIGAAGFACTRFVLRALDTPTKAEVAARNLTDSITFAAMREVLAVHDTAIARLGRENHAMLCTIVKNPAVFCTESSDHPSRNP